MPDTTTPNYGLTKMQVGGDRDAWGDKLNTNMDVIDTALHAAAASVPDVSTLMPKAGGDFAAAPTVGGGVVLHFASGITGGLVTLSAASGADPTVNPGDVWLGF